MVLRRNLGDFEGSPEDGMRKVLNHLALQKRLNEHSIQCYESMLSAEMIKPINCVDPLHLHSEQLIPRTTRFTLCGSGPSLRHIFRCLLGTFNSSQ